MANCLIKCLAFGLVILMFSCSAPPNSLEIDFLEVDIADTDYVFENDIIPEYGITLFNQIDILPLDSSSDRLTMRSIYFDSFGRIDEVVVYFEDNLLAEDYSQKYTKADVNIRKFQNNVGFIEKRKSTVLIGSIYRDLLKNRLSRSSEFSLMKSRIETSTMIDGGSYLFEVSFCENYFFFYFHDHVLGDGEVSHSTDIDEILDEIVFNTN